MTFYQQPERELTAEEELLAAVVELDQHVPGGY